MWCTENGIYNTKVHKTCVKITEFGPIAHAVYRERYLQYQGYSLSHTVILFAFKCYSLERI